MVDPQFIGQDLLIDGLGGNANERVDETRGISVEDNSEITSSGDVEIIGRGGNSEFETTFSDGISISRATIDAQGFLKIEGKGGDGEVVETSNGISVTAAIIDSGQDLFIEGVGGDAHESVIESRGAEIFFSELNSPSDLIIDGAGVYSNNISIQVLVPIKEYFWENNLGGHNINLSAISGNGGYLLLELRCIQIT